MDHLDSRRLRHFLGVYDAKSIGKAAARLHLAQPTVSKSIKLLEDELRVPLFERTPLGMIPTSFADVLHRHAQTVGAELRAAREELTNMRGALKGHANIGVGPSIAASVMPEVIHRLMRAQPGLRVTVSEGLVDTLIRAVRQGEIEAAVGGWPPMSDHHMMSEILFTDRLGVIVSRTHPLARLKNVTLGMLLEYPWALPPGQQRWRMALDAIFVDAGLVPPIPLVVSNSSPFLRTLLLDGAFLSFLPEQRWRSRTVRDRWMQIGPPESRARIEVTATYRDRASLSAASRNVINEIHKVATERLMR